MDSSSTGPGHTDTGSPGNSACRTRPFRRHYPDIAREIAANRSAAAPSRDTPSEQDKIIARNSRLRCRNREPTIQLKLAAARIQHLALANASLLEALQKATNVTRLSKRPERRSSRHQ